MLTPLTSHWTNDKLVCITVLTTTIQYKQAIHNSTAQAFLTLLRYYQLFPLYKSVYYYYYKNCTMQAIYILQQGPP